MKPVAMYSLVLILERKRMALTCSMFCCIASITLPKIGHLHVTILGKTCSINDARGEMLYPSSC
jgi:hypothetical protein